MIGEQLKSRHRNPLRDWIFTQQRVGYQGKVFTLYKLRTMIHGADQECPLGLLEGGDKSLQDERILESRKWLRLTGLDELPQALNILKGDMTLVGPRPTEYARFKHYSKNEKARIIKVKPGIFGTYALKHLDRHNRSLKQLEQIFLEVQREKMKDPIEYVGFQAWVIWYSMKEVFAGRHI